MGLETSDEQSTKMELLNFILHNAPAGVIVVDGQMRITDLNPLAERITGFSREEALGRPCGEIFRGSRCGPECPLPTLTGGEIDREDVLTNRHGEQVFVLLSSLAFRDDQGGLRGGALIFRDLSPFKNLERERRHLAGMFAHDLKTPVVAAAGLLDRLLQGKGGPLLKEQKLYLDTIRQEIQQLERLISGFVDFCRLDLHILMPQAATLEVEKEGREVLLLVQPLAEAKGIALKARFPATPLVLHGDPLLLRRALENLLDNAIKYSPAKTKVVLEVKEAGPNVQFSVKDQGTGIPSQDLPHLFEAFYRGSGAGPEGGFGLGLATVKRIVDAHHGRLWVKTSPRGSTFFFTLPRSPEGISP